MRGDFCDLYEPIRANEDAATVFLQADPAAARRAAQNEATYLACPVR